MFHLYKNAFILDMILNVINSIKIISFFNTLFYWIYPRDGKQQRWDPNPKVNYCVHCILKFIISFSSDKIFTKTLISQIETWSWNCCSYNKHQKILDKHAVPVEAWSSLHPLEVDFVRNLRWNLFLFTTYSTWLGTMLICFSISFHCHFQFRTNPTYICKKILQSCTKHQIQIKIWFTSIFVFIIILFLYLNVIELKMQILKKNMNDNCYTLLLLTADVRRFL